MSATDLIDSQGRTVLLGSQLGRGGEGTVYEVRQLQATVAKVYHTPLTRERADKVRTMISMRTDALSRLASWPIEILLAKTSKQPVGLLMPMITGRKNVHHLYGPKSRLQDFPRADWRFLVRASTNIARAFATVHEHGCVIGDVNHSSIMVAQDATACLIDCDSFQISANGKQFLCDVGVETFTPPELQGHSFRGVVRTPNFDNFGLAVMIFHLLFMGRHPFAGRFRGAGEMPIGKAIREFRFPYGSNHVAVQMDQPPGTPSLSFVGAQIAAFFEAAFSREAISRGRPPARSWVTAMEVLEKSIKRCATDAGHWHPSHLTTCPWCQMESMGAKSLFPFVFAAASTPARGIDVAAMLRQLDALSPIGAAPAFSRPPPLPSAAARQIGRPKFFAKPLAGLIASGIFLGGVVMAPMLFWIFGFVAIIAYNIAIKMFVKKKEIERLQREHTDTQSAFDKANQEWTIQAGDASYNAARRTFVELKAEYDQFPVKRQRAFELLKQNQRKMQLDKFLDNFDIEDAKIDGIGPGRKRTLESYGIETAQDLEPARLSAVPGFGPKMSERLMRWRRGCEAKFVFDPARGIDPQDVAKLETALSAMRTKLEIPIKNAFGEVIRSHSRVLNARQQLRPKLETLHTAAAQAKVDYDFVSGK